MQYFFLSFPTGNAFLSQRISCAGIGKRRRNERGWFSVDPAIKAGKWWAGGGGAGRGGVVVKWFSGGSGDED